MNENRRKAMYGLRRPSSAVALAAGIIAWTCGTQLTPVGAAVHDYPYGVCCDDDVCETAVKSGDVYYCMGVAKLEPFGGSCHGIQACYFSDAPCKDIDGYCCGQQLGTECGDGTSCNTNIQACCRSDNTCRNIPAGCCQEIGGTPLGAGSVCNVNVQACCFGDGTCANMKMGCCLLAGGTPLGSGTVCNPDIQACCFSDDDECLDIDPGCCEAQDGVPAGSGTACSDFDGWICEVAWACCLQENPFCDNAGIHYCGTQLGGTPVPDWDCNDWLYYNPDGDQLIEPCDNCPDTPNAPWKGTCTHGNVGAECWANSECDITSGDGFCSMDQEDSEPSPPTTGDGVGDACDNCPATHNMGQENGDDDKYGDVCDNCPDHPNTGQENCDAWSGDTAGDACDADIDGDGVLNEDDVCDYTPQDAIDEPLDPLGGVITVVGHRLRGTVYGDVNGDCDRDADDTSVLFDTEPSCDDGGDHFDVSCPECPECPECPPCRGQQY